MDTRLPPYRFSNAVSQIEKERARTYCCWLLPKMRWRSRFLSTLLVSSTLHNAKCRNRIGVQEAGTGVQSRTLLKEKGLTLLLLLLQAPTCDGAGPTPSRQLPRRDRFVITRGWFGFRFAFAQRRHLERIKQRSAASDPVTTAATIVAAQSQPTTHACSCTQAHHCDDSADNNHTMR